VHHSPCLILFHIFIQPPEGVVYPAMQYKLGRPLLNLLWCDLMEKGYRVMVNLPPKMRVQVSEEADDLRMPRPPEILSQGAKTIMEIDFRTFHQ
jgi:hypothetical protein